jgi:hypothetical protein
MELSLGTKDELFKILSQIAVVVTFIARDTIVLFRFKGLSRILKDPMRSIVKIM